VWVYPSGLKFWADQCDKTVYGLYHQIQEFFQWIREINLTIFHLRDDYDTSLEEVMSRVN
ncbi:MAG: hypothetical protein KKE39_02080, partial [Bacteroidetes bacterium]|nr:hypothetical protein [Bacteroidota bacterium]MBU1760502.1 hypothetical protein [Bacteroidota bacterium]